MKTNIRIATMLLTGSLFTLLFFGCQQGQQEQPEHSVDDIRQQISQYRNTISELNQKINALERILEEEGALPGRPNGIPVSTMPVESQVFENYFRVTGSLEAVNTSMISPEISGQLQRIYVNKGDAVEKGQVVAALSTQVIERNIEEVKSNLEFAQTVYERQKRLWAQEIGSEIQYLEAGNNLKGLQNRLRTLEAQRELAYMRSPIDGYVDETFIKTGELVVPGTPVMQIVNLDELYVNADVSEAFLRYVKKGETVRLRFPAFPAMEIQTKIYRVGNVINPENRSFRMQLLIRNQDKLLKPNLMANISIRSFSVEDAIVVPTMLIGFDTQGHFVFTARERNGLMTANKKYITRGPDAEGKTMVEQGLYPGELLITKGQQRLSEGDLIRIIDSE